MPVSYVFFFFNRIPYVLSSFISFRTPIGNVAMYVLYQIM